MEVSWVLGMWCWDPWRIRYIPQTLWLLTETEFRMSMLVFRVVFIKRRVWELFKRRVYKGEKTELRPVSGTAFGYRFERRAIEEGRERVAERHWTLDFPGGSDGKASACNAGDPGSIPGLGKSSGEGNGNPLQYSCLENPMDRGTW